jgi:hypothetical protein
MLDRTGSIYHPIQLHDWGKSRLADTFGESCPMINFILRKDEGYPPGDSEILAFMCEKLPKELPRSPMRFPNHHQGGEDRSAFDTRRTAAIWNQSCCRFVRG